jgi:hypothetical protein
MVVQFPVASASLLQRVQNALVASGVASGIEQAPPDSDEATQPGAVVTTSLRLSGRRVGDILDAVVALDPRYRWSESRRRVTVRVRPIRGKVGDEGLLGRVLPELVLRRASMQEALAALRGVALTPEHRLMTTHYPLLRPSRAEISNEPTVTVSLEHPTLGAALDAISESAGNLSWLVTYQGTAGTVDAVRISFVGPDRSFTAFPPLHYSIVPK